MKITAAGLLTAYPALMKFSQKEGMGAKASYRIGKILRKVGEEWKDIEAQKLAIARKYGKEENGRINVPDEKMAEFEAEIKPLLDDEIELEGIALIAFADWSRVEHSPAVLADLHLFLEAPTE